MKQKYTKPEINSVEFKMERGYAASQAFGSFLTTMNTYDFETDELGVKGNNRFGSYFTGSTDNWD